MAAAAQTDILRQTGIEGTDAVAGQKFADKFFIFTVQDIGDPATGTSVTTGRILPRRQQRHLYLVAVDRSIDILRRNEYFSGTFSIAGNRTYGIGI